MFESIPLQRRVHCENCGHYGVKENALSHPPNPPDVEGSDLAQWKSDDGQTIVRRAQYATGMTVYPFADPRK